jgi:LmbE family N-acetylglucosaminyl deacetylase
VLNPEDRLIPYQTSPLPAGPWLVFAPHADDETYGMGGSLLRASAEGVATHVIVLTDGALGGSSEDLVAVRASEVKAAARALGLSSLQSWQEPDRGLAVSQPLIQRIAAAIAELAPASVFFPGPLEIHPDHRNTALLVWAALQSLSATAETPAAYSYEISVQNPVNLFVDISAQRPAKEQVMTIYASQNVENNYEELVLSLDKGRTFSLPANVSHAEGFYQYTPQQLQSSLKDTTHDIIERYFLEVE